MRTTIDAAGRVVIPKALRDAAGLSAGEVELLSTEPGYGSSPSSVGASSPDAAAW